MRLPHPIPLHRQRREAPRTSLLAVETYVEEAGDPYSSLGVRPPAPPDVTQLIIAKPSATSFAAAS